MPPKLAEIILLTKGPEDKLFYYNNQHSLGHNYIRFVYYSKSIFFLLKDK